MICNSHQMEGYDDGDWVLEIVLSFKLVPRFVESRKYSTGDHTLLGCGGSRDLTSPSQQIVRTVRRQVVSKTYLVRMHFCNPLHILDLHLIRQNQL